MGAAASTCDNDDLTDYLVKEGPITRKDVERAFRLVDRGRFIPGEDRQEAYRDSPYKEKEPNLERSETGELIPTGVVHLSAPCIYSSAINKLDLQPGNAFLNIGSGTGYFSTIIGFIIGETGINHGIEIHQNMVEYAYDRLEDTLRGSESSCFNFCKPTFFCGNGLLISHSSDMMYDRVYVGAGMNPEQLDSVARLLKIGGILVAPVADAMIQYTRNSETEFERDAFSHVSFASLLTVRPGTVPCELPATRCVGSLKELCRCVIRDCLRKRAHQEVAVAMRVQVGKVPTDELERDAGDAGVTLHVAAQNPANREMRLRPVRVPFRREALPHIRVAQAQEREGIARLFEGRRRLDGDENAEHMDAEDDERRARMPDADSDDEEVFAAIRRQRRIRLLEALMLGERDHQRAHRRGDERLGDDVGAERGGEGDLAEEPRGIVLIGVEDNRDVSDEDMRENASDDGHLIFDATGETSDSSSSDSGESHEAANDANETGPSRRGKSPTPSDMSVDVEEAPRATPAAGIPLDDGIVEDFVHAEEHNSEDEPNGAGHDAQQNEIGVEDPVSQSILSIFAGGSGTAGNRASESSGGSENTAVVSANEPTDTTSSESIESDTSMRDDSSSLPSSAAASTSNRRRRRRRPDDEVEPEELERREVRERQAASMRECAHVFQHHLAALPLPTNLKAYIRYGVPLDM